MRIKCPVKGVSQWMSQPVSYEGCRQIWRIGTEGPIDGVFAELEIRKLVRQYRKKFVLTKKGKQFYGWLVQEHLMMGGS